MRLSIFLSFFKYFVKNSIVNFNFGEKGDGHGAEDEIVEEDVNAASSNTVQGANANEPPRWEASQLRGQSTSNLPSPSSRGTARPHQPPLLRTRSNKTNENPDAVDAPLSPHSNSPRTAAIPIQSHVRSASQASITNSPTGMFFLLFAIFTHFFKEVPKFPNFHQPFFSHWKK